MKRVGGVVAFAAALWSSGCYVTDLGWGQFKLILKAREVDAVLVDPAVDAVLRERLQVLGRARQFGVESLGLKGAELYHRFVDTEGQPVVWNVSACPVDALQPRTWKFPIVGEVPYLGFFERAAAEREKARLEAQGDEVLLRPVTAYSTLGWLKDPVYSCALMGSDLSVVRFTLHEMTHATVFVPGHVDFNEGLASFVEREGTLRYLAAHGDADEVARVRKRFAEEAQSFEILHSVYGQLEALYNEGLAREPLLARRANLFKAGKARLEALAPSLEEIRVDGWIRRPWNNPFLLSFRRYHGWGPRLERLLAERFDGRVRDLLRSLDETEDPEVWVQSVDASGS